MNKRGNLEILLLLCCLVSVMSFVCFAMGIVNLSAMVDQNPPADLQDSLKESAAENKQIRMDEEVSQLRNYISEQEKSLREKQQQLAGLHDLGDKPTEKARSLQNLKRKVAELDNRVMQRKNALNTLKSKNSKAGRLESEVRELERQVEAAKKKNKELKAKPVKPEDSDNLFNPWTDFGGSDLITNPMFVECRKESVTIYPEDKVIANSDISRHNPFRNLSSGHDGIVFLVRPDGFDTFELAFEKANETKLKIGYEPIDIDWQLDFSKRR